MAVAVVANDLAAQVRVRRLGQSRTGQAVAARARVELAAVGRERGDGVAAVGAAAVDPARAAVVAVDVSRLARAGLAGAHEQLAVVDRHRHDVDGVAGPSAVGPDRLGAGVDAELDVAVVGLTVRHPGPALDAPVQAAAGGGVVLAHQVAEDVVERFLGVHPDGEREVALAEAERGARRDFDVGRFAVEPRGTVGCPAGAGGGQVDREGPAVVARPDASFASPENFQWPIRPRSSARAGKPVRSNASNTVPRMRPSLGFGVVFEQSLASCRVSRVETQRQGEQHALDPRREPMRR